MRKFFFIIGFLGLLCSDKISANDGGTESPFSLGAGARELGMGSADLSNSGFETSPYWNPSRLALAQQYQFSGFHSQLFESGVAYQYLGLVAPTLDFGTFGVGVFRLGVNGIEIRDINNFLLGETEDNRLGLYFAFGRRLSKFDFGAAISMEHHSLADYSATSSPGLNLSVSKIMSFKSNTFKQLSLALNARNVIKPSIELDNESVSYPVSGLLSATLGICPIKDGSHELSLAVALGKTEKIDPVASMGLEYGFNELLFLRGGLNNGNFAAGIGIKYSVVSFDYAIVDRDLDLLHTFSLTTSFGKPVKQRQEERLAKREAEFNKVMNRQLSERNIELVKSMTKEGENFFENGKLVEAVSSFERALFMARANGLDTNSIAELHQSANNRLNEVMRLKQYREYIDSARVAQTRADYISAKYFASLALEQQSNSSEAQKLIDMASKALSGIAKREDLVNQRLVSADSLLNYGKIPEAILILNGLKQHYAGDSRIENAWNKAHFERLKEKASTLQVKNNFTEAMSAVDSALQIFPNHEWCLAMKSTINSRMAFKSGPAIPVRPAQPVKLSEQLQKEAEQEYGIAQNLFTKGDLAGAIEHWEKIERIAPDFHSVREHLLKAYKFLGVEYYGKGELRQAIAVWKKASQLSPGNEEILKYIKRTETELGKLEQLSYESQ